MRPDERTIVILWYSGWKAGGMCICVKMIYLSSSFSDHRMFVWCGAVPPAHREILHVA